jgi:D-beta-D-heptose 7-phosphate kinase/D-beta-D-heptose 1-phosphate adenosyltransferase
MINTRTKLMSLKKALVWRDDQAGPVVFTNGVFDLLHPGHVELLEAARREGAVLIVGVNSDASARRLGKGPDRPLNDAAARSRVLAGLAAVDSVVIFDQDTPLELIHQLAPDVLVKGADYARSAIVGADLVESRGGRVVRVPLVTGFSTSNIVDRFRA